MTNAWLTEILTFCFGTSNTLASYYFGLIDATGFTGTDKINDTMSSHAGWTEFTSYSETGRQTWVPGAVSNASITNPSEAAYTPTVAGSVVGYFLTDNSTKGGTTGNLVDIVMFDEPQPTFIGEAFLLKHTWGDKDLSL